jgi:hypothetical protein
MKQIIHFKKWSKLLKNNIKIKYLYYYMISFENIDGDSSLLLQEFEKKDTPNNIEDDIPEPQSLYNKITNVIQEIIEYFMNIYSADKSKEV